MNGREEWLKQQIVKIIASFERDKMSIAPTSVSLNLHPNSLVVTFCGAACPAEIALADDSAMARLLERFYAAAFDASKRELEQAIASILGRRVTRSKFAMDPQSGDGVLLFELSEDALVTPAHESPEAHGPGESDLRSGYDSHEEKNRGH